MPAPNILLISTDQEIVVEEEITPGLIQQDSVGLESILDNHFRFVMVGLEFYRIAKEIQAHQGGLTPLPGENDLLERLSRQELGVYSSRRSSLMRKLAPGYNFSFFR